MYGGFYTGFKFFSMYLGFLRTYVIRQVTADKRRNFHVLALAGDVLNIMPVYCELFEESLSVVPTTICLGSFSYFTYAMLSMRLVFIVPLP